MKTLREFIQRLQEDPAFEKKAQAFDNGNDLMAFVKGEGYHFTLDQLAGEFKHGSKSPAEAAGMAPAPPEVRASTSPRPDSAAFPRQTEAITSRELSAALPDRGRGDISREQPGLGLQKPLEIFSLGRAERLPGESPRVGGGRHRGFSPRG